MEHELWFTKLLNDYCAGLGNAILALFRVHAENAERPWQDFISMQILVALIIVALFALLRSRLSVDRPGNFQHLFEWGVYGFVKYWGEQIIGQGSSQYLAFPGTLFIFILLCNLIGVVPFLGSPTQYPPVPAGCAMAAFLYYNIQGAKVQGAGKYLAHFLGPVLPLAPLMVPIEIISHLARAMSLTIRLFANMFAGELVTVIFLGLAVTYSRLLIPVVAPALFMFLHVGVSLLQAFIFMLLTMIYLQGAVAHDH